ncbi:Crp/Fnr family transcriptional regulator [Desulfitobacterium metallireducens]|uniref:cAMP-binding protein n=1 Tax=Desulfitobacterium metallireducens DSM 15288 TaxID=871968 RepID=W0E824_9FIRM|nr:Crp/Fnr family transcriptional regulator [Desulfitobacterium metallireducens]AHF06932.1 cAMP-binding protein [Desulfitobacterium metallireducens DSM 15288]
MMKNKDDLERFSQSSPWDQLPLTFWELCQLHSRVRHYSSKQYLFFSGEEANTFFLLLKGRVELLLMSEFTEKIFRVIQAPNFFPEVALDGKTYPYAALAVENSEVLVLDRTILLRYLNENPQALMPFYQSMALDLRRAYRQIKNVALGDARSRLGAKLFALSHAHGQPVGDGILITIPLSTTELAGMCSLARESVSRILGELKELEIIEVERKKIKILNKEKLREWVHERLGS